MALDDGHVGTGGRDSQVDVDVPQLLGKDVGISQQYNHQDNQRMSSSSNMESETFSFHMRAGEQTCTHECAYASDLYSMIVLSDRVPT